MGCIFCNVPKDRILLQTVHAYCIFSLWPVSEFHSLIIPKRHVDDTHLNFAEVSDMFLLKTLMIDHLGLKDYNFGVNNGKSAGQTVQHAHYHLIPRNVGDSPNPRGGIRNVIPEKGAPDGDSRESEVLEWTNKFQMWTIFPTDCDSDNAR